VEKVMAIFNQPTNPPTHQPTNPPTNQPTNQPTNTPVFTDPPPANSFISGKHRLVKYHLGGGFKDFLCSPLFGKDSYFDSCFSTGLVQPPTSNGLLRPH